MRALFATRYSELEQAAAFACANRLCSLPVSAPAEVASGLSEVDRR